MDTSASPSGRRNRTTPFATAAAAAALTAPAKFWRVTTRRIVHCLRKRERLVHASAAGT